MALKRSRPERELVSPRLQSFCALHGVPDPESAMRIACRTLLAECGVTAPPVPLNPLLDYLKMRKVRRATLGSATLRLRENAFEVWISGDASRWRRERFTVAHEIAHVLLLIGSSDDREGIAPDQEGSREHEEIERLCNLGAAEILMPSRLVLDALLESGLSAVSLQRMYDRFLVSFETLLFRLAEALPSSAVILWRKYARHASEPVTLRVRTSYQRYRQAASAPWLPKDLTAHKHLRPDIVTAAFDQQASVFSRNLIIELNQRVDMCLGVATVLPQPRRIRSQMPLFEGRRVLDEAVSNADVVLLICKRSLQSNPSVWDSIEEKSLQ